MGGWSMSRGRLNRDRRAKRRLRLSHAWAVAWTCGLLLGWFALSLWLLLEAGRPGL